MMIPKDTQEALTSLRNGEVDKAVIEEALQLVNRLKSEYSAEVKIASLSQYLELAWEPLMIRGVASVFNDREGAEALAEQVLSETRIVHRFITDKTVVK